MRHMESSMMRENPPQPRGRGQRAVLISAAAEDFRGRVMRRIRLEFDEPRQEERYREESFEEARASVFTRRERAPTAISVAPRLGVVTFWER